MCNMDNVNFLANAPGSPESIRRAIRNNKWGLGGGVSGDSNVHTSWDDLLGGWGASEEWDKLPGAVGNSAGNRRVGRGVGLVFGAAAAGSAAGGAEAGATEVGAGLPLAEEAGGATTGLIGEGSALGEGAAAEIASGEEVAPGIIADSTAPSEIATTPGQVIDAPATTGPTEIGQGLPLAEEAGVEQAATAEKGLFTSAMDWVNAKPVNTLIAGQAIGGAAGGAMSSISQKKAEKAKREQQERDIAAQQELKDYPRRVKQGNPSVGGGGVNVNLKRGPDGVLRRPDGSPVYNRPGGILTRGMTGPRG